MQSDAQRAASARYHAKLDYIGIRIPPDASAPIRAAAASVGQSITAYIVQACRERMEREGQPATLEPSGDGPAPEA